MEIYLKESLQNKISPQTTTTPQKPVVRSLAADLAHVFNLGQLSQRDFRKLPKNLQNEIAALQNREQSIPIPQINKETKEGTMEMPAIVADIPPEPKEEVPISAPSIPIIPEKLEEEKNQEEVTAVPIAEEVVTVPVFTADAIKAARQSTKIARENLFKGGAAQEDRVVEVKAVQEVSATVPVTSVTEEALFNTKEPHEDISKKITETLATLDEKESALQNLKEKESVFNGHIEELKKKTAPIRQRERELEQAISATENQNQGQMSKEKIEERWRLENERKEVEEARWSIDEEQISLSKERDLLLTQKESLEKEIKELREKVEALRGKEERMLLLVERQKIDSRLEEIAKSEEPLELEWINLNEKKVEITKEILPLKGILDGTMRDYKTVSSEEKNASDPTKEHEVESKRWQIEERRRGAERELLAFNEKLEEVERTISTLTATYQGFLKEEEKLKNRIQEINVRSSRLPT